MKSRFSRRNTLQRASPARRPRRRRPRSRGRPARRAGAMPLTQVLDPFGEPLDRGSQPRGSAGTSTRASSRRRPRRDGAGTSGEGRPTRTRWCCASPSPRTTRARRASRPGCARGAGGRHRAGSRADGQDPRAASQRRRALEHRPASAPARRIRERPALATPTRAITTRDSTTSRGAPVFVTRSGPRHPRACRDVSPIPSWRTTGSVCRRCVPNDRRRGGRGGRRARLRARRGRPRRRPRRA